MLAITKLLIDVWTTAAGITEGYLFRPVNKGDRVCGAKIANGNAAWLLGRQYCQAAGVTNIAPHDFRRTFAKLARRGQCPMEEIQRSLGHASIVTIQRYVETEQNLVDAPCDHLGLTLTVDRVA